MTFSLGFFYAILFFVFGIGLASFFNFSVLSLLLLLSLSIFLLFIPLSFKGPKQIVLGLCILFLVLGILRYNLAEIDVASDRLSQFQGLNKEVILTGMITKDPDSREASSRLLVNVKEIEIDGQKAAIDSNVLVLADVYPEYKYGDQLKVRGFLLEPETFEDFNYKEFLKKDRIYSIMRYPDIDLISSGNGNILMSAILIFKDRARQIIYENMPPPESSILIATLLGDQRKLPEKLAEKLSITGVMHIVAISGAHITLLTVALVNVFLLLGFWRSQAFYFTILTIAFYVMMIGFQPSAVRAALMGCIFLLAQYFGRLSISMRLLIFAMALMLLGNPFLLKLDIGFQLSFLAMIGIIYLLPLFERWFSFIKNKEIRMILAMTFAAYFFTLPIIVYNFGNISFVAPFTNLLLVPVSYWIMILGLMFILISFIFPFLAFWLSLPSWFLLSYFVGVVNWFSEIPLSYIVLKNINVIWIIIYYAFLAFLIKKAKNEKGMVTAILYR